MVHHVSLSARFRRLHFRHLSFFVYEEGARITSLLLYVDDIILTASSLALLQHIKAKFSSEFAMTDLGELHHFLSIVVTRSIDGMFLSQR
jgi:hypothetical protein